jgi:steroid 5-alpha reductase family enzyme
MTTVIVTFATTLLVFIGLWLISLRLGDASIVDFYWGPGFAVIAWIAWCMSGRYDPFQLMLCFALSLWGFRLGWHIFKRHKGEDPRYQELRKNHGAAFGQKSLWLVFGLQAVIQWLASSPILVAMLASSQQNPVLLALGAAMFISGFILEWQADVALSRFKADPKNKGKLLKTGMFRKVRHPNYLGEIILQFGIGLMAFGLTLNPFAFFGPLLMTALIVKLSGVPMLETQLSKREGFVEWKATSGALWPK